MRGRVGRGGGENVYEGGGRRWECAGGGEGSCGVALGAGCVWGVKRAAGIGGVSCVVPFTFGMAVRVFGLGWVMQVGAAVVRLCVNRCV